MDAALRLQMALWAVNANAVGAGRGVPCPRGSALLTLAMVPQLLYAQLLHLLLLLLLQLLYRLVKVQAAAQRSALRGNDTIPPLGRANATLALTALVAMLVKTTLRVPPTSLLLLVQMSLLPVVQPECIVLKLSIKLTNVNSMRVVG